MLIIISTGDKWRRTVVYTQWVMAKGNSSTVKNTF